MRDIHETDIKKSREVEEYHNIIHYARRRSI